MPTNYCIYEMKIELIIYKYLNLKKEKTVLNEFVPKGSGLDIL